MATSIFIDPTGGGSGSGTVTDVSVVTANGVSGSVANSTTTPAITLTLGAITPTTVNALTLASQAVGFTIAGGTTSKTATIAGNFTTAHGDDLTLTTTGSTNVTLPTSGTLLTSAGAVTSITGTANQVVASGATGAVTLSTPQSIATTSTPQFARLGLGAAADATASLSTTGPVLLPVGSASLPSLTGPHVNSGIYFPASGAYDIVTIVSNGAAQVGIDGSYGLVVSAGQFIALAATGVAGATADVGLVRPSSGLLRVNNGQSSSTLASLEALNLNASTTFKLNGVLFSSATAPTIASGFGSSPSIAASNGTACFTINVGTGGTAQNGVITMPAAPNGWAAFANDLTTNASFVTAVSATSTTTITLQNYSRTTGTAIAWTASDIVQVIAFPY